jgi:hypothetical protein
VFIRGSNWLFGSILFFMDRPSTAEITVLLKAWTGGDAAALDKLIPLVYGELRRVARKYMRKEGRAASCRH